MSGNFMRFLSALLSLFMPLSVAAMEPLEDAVLASVTGREGVAVDLELRVNMTEEGVPLSGQAGHYGTNCVGQNNPCRWALSFANRDNVWLVFNGWSLATTVTVDIDVTSKMTSASIPGFDLSMTDDRPPSHNRFFNVSNQCMLTGCTTPADIPAAIQDMPAMRITTPSSVLSYDALNNRSMGFDNTRLALNLEGAAAITAVDGFGAPVPGTFVGAQIGDMEQGNNFAGWAFQGEVYVFGY